MPTDLNLWRAQIGSYHCSFGHLQNLNNKITTSTFNMLFYTVLQVFLLLLILTFSSFTLSAYMLHIINNVICHNLIAQIFIQCFFIFMLLLLSGDIEQNPGPRSTKNLSIVHWNINSIAAHNFIKLSSLQAFNSIHKFDLICISESFLDSTFSTDDSALSLKGYKLIRSDHPQDVKRGGTCIYYKDTLPIKFLNIFNLSECLICEIQYEKKNVTLSLCIGRLVKMMILLIGLCLSLKLY